MIVQLYIAWSPHPHQEMTFEQNLHAASDLMESQETSLGMGNQGAG